MTERTKSTPIVTLAFGLVLFLIGMFGNFYHHWILRSLRPDKTYAFKYVLPTGALFNYLITPHYFFEIISWAGICVAGNNDYYFWCVLLAVTIYLITRSMLTKKWYLEKMSEHQKIIKQRKIMIPFIF